MYVIEFIRYVFYALLINIIYTTKGLDQPHLCPGSPQNQTVQAAVGSSAKFSACVLIPNTHEFYSTYEVRFQRNESFRLLFEEMEDTKYKVDLIIGEVKFEHFGTHIVSVMKTSSQQDVINVFLTLLEEENTIMKEVLPICVTVGVAFIIIVSAIVLKKAGNRCQRYTINKNIYSMKKFFKRQARKPYEVTSPNQTTDDNHYDTVDEVITRPDDTANGIAIANEGVIALDYTHDASLAMRYTPMDGRRGSPSIEGYAASLGLDSEYITPIDVVRNSGRCKKKSKSLQRDALKHTAKKEFYRLKSSKSMDSRSNDFADNAEDSHYYCNCQPFKKTQEPTLLSIKQLRSSNQNGDYVQSNRIPSKVSVAGQRESDAKAGKSTEYKCHKYVNLEQFWDGFRGCNQESDRKRSLNRDVEENANFKKVVRV